MIYIYIQYIALCTQSLWLVIPAGNLAYGERSENIADQAFFSKTDDLNHIIAMSNTGR